MERANPDIPPILLDTGNRLGVVRTLLAACIDPLSIQDVFIIHRHPGHAGDHDPLLIRRRTRMMRAGDPMVGILQAFDVAASRTPAALGEVLQRRQLVDGQPSSPPSG